MSYTPPTITASSNTFPLLQTSGYIGHIDKIIGTNAFNANVTKLLKSWRSDKPMSSIMIQVFDEVQRLIDQYTEGLPVANATVTQQVLDFATFFSTLSTVMNEIGVLIDANQGTLKSAPSANFNQTVYYRTFP